MFAGNMLRDSILIYTWCYLVLLFCFDFCDRVSLGSSDWP
jgi:hypothetical protein